MQVRELESDEKVVLVGLVRHLVLADGEVSDSELYDLIRLGVEIGKEDFRAALAATEESHRDRAATLATVDAVTRDVARAKIGSELDRIAAGDGVDEREAAFITAVRARCG